MVAWTKFERGELIDAVVNPTGEICSGDGEAAVTVADDEQQREEAAERIMYQVAFWCVQQRPAEARPPMSAVVKMLEGEMDVVPPVNLFLHLMADPATATNPWATTTASSGDTVSGSVMSQGSDGNVSL
uniref:Serine-threonine/tyrosine-protein kinase catalytic domain-containing protein n=1 Tax=Oryza brachyantha TaxID=4533 RepID=J3MIG7_ORYBR